MHLIGTQPPVGAAAVKFSGSRGRGTGIYGKGSFSGATAGWGLALQRHTFCLRTADCCVLSHTVARVPFEQMDIQKRSPGKTQ